MHTRPTDTLIFTPTSPTVAETNRYGTCLYVSKQAVIQDLSVLTHGNVKITRQHLKTPGERRQGSQKHFCLFLMGHPHKPVRGYLSQIHREKTFQLTAMIDSLAAKNNKKNILLKLNYSLNKRPKPGDITNNANKWMGKDFKGTVWQFVKEFNKNNLKIVFLICFQSYSHIYIFKLGILQPVA